MRNLLMAAGIVLSSLSMTNLFAAEQPESIDDRATYRQVALIELARDGSDRMKANAFCLSAKGDILACCGNGPGEIRVYDRDGHVKHSWEVPVKPEAINTAVDGTVLVGGSGRLFRFSPEGQLLQQTESPHAVALKENKAKLREDAIQQLERTNNRSRNGSAARIGSYTRIIEQLQKKKDEGELNEQEERILKILPERLEKLKEQLQNENDIEESKISEEAIQQTIENMAQMKMRIASISTDGKHVYVAAHSVAGYAFDVWRMDSNFENGKVIVAELRGCCGHMDVQACSSGIYVAENARHRVACFNADGELITTWGGRDRKGIDGFTSCCNPMNVCFNKAGDVYTAESSTGRIKRFSADGQLQEFIGDVDLVPGCKNVSIAVSPDNRRVYMLDITRNHIVLMERTDDRAGTESKG